MNGKIASFRVGITYGQLQYFVRRIDALSKKETSQGHDHEFNYRDIVYLKLASLMRSDGIGLSEINQAIKVVNATWTNIENPTDAGVLIRRADDLFPWTWSADYNLVLRGDGMLAPIHYLKHIPAFFYNVGAIAVEFSDVGQMELDLMFESSAVQH